MRNVVNVMMVPRRATDGSAGYDFIATEDIKLRPWKTTYVDSGVVFDGTEKIITVLEKIGEDGSTWFEPCYLGHWVMQIHPRSSLGFKYGLRLKNTTGIIDSDYRDTIKFPLTVSKPLTIKKGERFAQGIFVPFGVLADEVEPTKKREGGIGSTGQ